VVATFYKLVYIVDSMLTTLPSAQQTE